MTHKTALNRILANSCSNPVEGKEGINTYRIELHCCAYIVTAKPLGNYEYEIIDSVAVTENPL